MTTRAFVHGDVSRHAVLPVLACGQIVMSADPPRHARPRRRFRAAAPAETDAYGLLAMARGRFPPAVVRKMYRQESGRRQGVPPAGRRLANTVDAEGGGRQDKLAAERRRRFPAWARARSPITTSTRPRNSASFAARGAAEHAGRRRSRHFELPPTPSTPCWTRPSPTASRWRASSTAGSRRTWTTASARR